MASRSACARSLRGSSEFFVKAATTPIKAAPKNLTGSSCCDSSYTIRSPYNCKPTCAAHHICCCDHGVRVVFVRVRLIVPNRLALLSTRSTESLPD